MHFFKFVPVKALFDIDFTPLPIVTETSPLQLRKAFSSTVVASLGITYSWIIFPFTSINVTVLPIVEYICPITLLLQKVDRSLTLTLIYDSFEQPIKAVSSIVFKLLGNVIEGRSQPSKAYFPMLVTLLGMSTEFKPQLQKTLSPIVVTSSGTTKLTITFPSLSINVTDLPNKELISPINVLLQNDDRLLTLTFILVRFEQSLKAEIERKL